MHLIFKVNIDIRISVGTQNVAEWVIINIYYNNKRK